MNQRWNDHVSKTKRGSNLPLCNAIRKYGRESFERSVLATVMDRTSLDASEKYYIAKYKSTDPLFGYNLSEGGNGTHGWVPSEDTKERISQGKRGKANGLKGAVFSQEHRLNLSKALLGRAFSEVSRQKMSKSQTGLKRGLRPEAVRRKISLSLKGHPPFKAGVTYSDRGQVNGKLAVNEGLLDVSSYRSPRQCETPV
jgi:group I intron endonuclease